MTSCTNCRHVGRSHTTAKGLPILLHECRHPETSGLMRCEACDTWNLLEVFSTVRRGGGVQLRCPEDGCRHVQTIPKDSDTRVGFLGHSATDQVKPFQLPSPSWCPGYLQTVSLNDAAEPKKKAPKPKRMSKKARQESEPLLF